MNRNYFLYLAILLSSFGCQEDADKVISTDLPAEANQMFEISTAWSESLYFSLLTFEEYATMDSTFILPGCPNVTVETEGRKVTLEFLASTECAQSDEGKRTGKINLTFPLTLDSTRTWTQSYENYTFKGTSIDGKRNYKQSKNGIVTETFDMMTQKTSKELTSILSGSLMHQKNAKLSSSIGLISTGTMTGRNAAGREFTIEIPEDRLMLTICFKQNELNPVSGVEIWTIDRGSSNQVTHRLTYELVDSCQVAANVLLPDGRKLLLNP